MTKKELKEATDLALSKESLANVDDSILNGFGLPSFKPVNVTIRQVAKMIRWQAVQFNGELNAKRYDELAEIGRTKFIICG